MQLLIELLTNVAVSGGVVTSILLAKHKILNKKIVSSPLLDPLDNTISWNIYSKSKCQSYNGFRCPKCINIDKNRKQFPICICEEYHKDHFHFLCGDCGYKGVLRTADDRR